MKLYYVPGVCSLSPHIALREAGLPFELVKVDPDRKLLPDGSDYRALNPLGYVPLLELDDGERLSEGPAIVQHVADQAPQAGLAPPAGTIERTRLQGWLGFVNAELHPRYSQLFDPALPLAVRQAVIAKLETRLEHVAAHLADRAFLLGDRFGVADGYLFTVLQWSRFVDIDLARWPALAAFQQRVAARPAVREALRAEGLLK